MLVIFQLFILNKNKGRNEKTNQAIHRCDIIEQAHLLNAHKKNEK